MNTLQHPTSETAQPRDSSGADNSETALGVADAGTRVVDRTIEIAAPPEAVWRALTEPDELARWFPLSARVTPGAGGSLVRSWTGSGDAESEVRERIDIWDPERHLRLVGLSRGWEGIVTDYLVEGPGGKTILRVVSSGFGSGEHWDEMLGAFGAGWDFELRGLRHYLERHRGTPREVVWARAHYEGSHDDAWRRLTSAGNWIAAPGLDALREAAGYLVETVAGDKLSGEVLLLRPPRQLVATVREWNDALLRLELHKAYGTGTANIWLSTYGVPAADLRSLQDKWQHALDTVMRT